jgi:hypothetical protein
MQILNGSDDLFFRKGLKRWIRLLLRGRRVSIVAGNDSHGNFNRFRQLSLPFLGIRENQTHCFGRARTAVYTGDHSDRKAIIEALRMSRSYITTGPSLCITLHNDHGERTIPGSVSNGSTFRIRLQAMSSEEFGTFDGIRIWSGTAGEKKEHLLWEGKHAAGRLNIDTVTDRFHGERFSYIRGEATTYQNGRRAFALTNPVWIGSVDKKPSFQTGTSQQP